MSVENEMRDIMRGEHLEQHSMDDIVIPLLEDARTQARTRQSALGFLVLF